MGDLTITQKSTSDSGTIKETDSGVQDLKILKVGAGSTVFYTDKEGSRWGSIVFDDANAYIKTDGSFKFKAPDGTILMNSSAVDGNFINIINTALNTSSKKILTDFTFESTDYAGAFKTGTPTWDENTGLPTGGTGFIINSAGIIGVNDGETTVAILSDGTATFAGTLSAPTGTIGAITLASTGNIKAGKTAYTDDTHAGFWLGIVSSVPKLNIGSSATKYLHYDGTDLIIIGATIQATSSASGVNIRLNPSNSSLEFLYNNSVQGYYYVDASGNTLVDADNSFYVTSNKYIYLESSNDTYVTCDNWFVAYNDDNDGSDCFWVSNGNTRMKLSSSGKLSIDGTYSDGGADFAEMFESVDGTTIPNGTSVVLKGDKIEPAKKGDIPFGVISANPTIIGNTDGVGEWKEKYLKDDFGNYVTEEEEYWIKKREFGNSESKKEKGWSDIVDAPKGAEKHISLRRKINPLFDSKQEYVSRKDRPEWNIVGLIGRLKILKGQPVAPNWIKLKDISDKVEEWLIK